MSTLTANTETAIELTPSERALAFRNVLNELEKNLPDGVESLVVNDWLDSEAKGFEVFVILKMGYVQSAIYGSDKAFYWLSPGTNETLQPYREKHLAPFKMRNVAPAVKRWLNTLDCISIRRYNSPKRREVYDTYEKKNVCIGYWDNYMSFDVSFFA